MGEIIYNPSKIKLLKKYPSGSTAVIEVTLDVVDYLLEYYPERYELLEEEEEGEGEGEGENEPRRRRGRPPKNVSQDNEG